MKINKTVKCPICSDIVIKYNPNYYLKESTILLSIVFLFPFYSFYICNMINVLANIVFYPSFTQYCDNNYKMCKYFPVDGILVSNTIKEKYENFNINYYVSSSYNWISNYKNGICYNVETHIYDSYDTALAIKEKSIGEIKNIYVSHSNPTNCIVKYKWYNQHKYNFFLSCKYSAIVIPFLYIAPIYFNIKYGDYLNLSILLTNNILECILNIFILIIHIIFMTCWIYTIFIVDYHLFYS